jgi:small subunit ribosomal protein S14
MKFQKIKDKKRRQNVKSFEQVRRALKACAVSETGDFQLQCLIKLQSLDPNSSPTRIKSRCVVTNRPRGVRRRFKLSRVELRKQVLSGKIPGYRRSTQ